jgi:hypothetical protein
VIGKGSSDNNEGFSNKINKMVGLTVVWCVERGLQYNFSRQVNIYLFCMKICIKASRCEVGGRNLYPAKLTSTHSYYFFPISVSRCRFGGKTNFHPKPTSTHSYACFLLSVSRCRFVFHVDVGFAGRILLPLSCMTMVFFH